MSEKTKGPRPLKAGWYEISVVRCRDQQDGEGRFVVTNEALAGGGRSRAALVDAINGEAQDVAMEWHREGVTFLKETREAERKARAEELLAELEELGYEQAGVVKSPTVGIAGPHVPGAGQEGEPERDSSIPELRKKQP